MLAAVILLAVAVAALSAALVAMARSSAAEQRRLVRLIVARTPGEAITLALADGEDTGAPRPDKERRDAPPLGQVM